ncbi:hypothetical protein ACFLV0_02835 [Chloroflexota bacterium]
MPDDVISIDEIIQKRTPSQLKDWVKQAMDRYNLSEEGHRQLVLHEGLAKPLMEEVFNLAEFGIKKFGNTDKILIQPIIGSQNYDAEISDLDTDPPNISFIEVTQAHEGEDEYLRSVVLAEKGIVTLRGPVIKRGTKKTGRQINVPYTATDVIQNVKEELMRIVEAAKRKNGKDYPPNTSLLIAFDDGLTFQRVISEKQLDDFVTRHIITLDLRVSTLYLLGWSKYYRE